MKRTVFLCLLVLILRVGFAESPESASRQPVLAVPVTPAEEVVVSEQNLKLLVSQLQARDHALRADRRAYIARLQESGEAGPYAEENFRQEHVDEYAHIEMLKHEIANVQEELAALLIRQSASAQTLPQKRIEMEIHDRIDAMMRTEKAKPSAEERAAIVPTKE